MWAKRQTDELLSTLLKYFDGRNNEYKHETIVCDFECAGQSCDSFYYEVFGISLFFWGIQMPKTIIFSFSREMSIIYYPMLVNSIDIFKSFEACVWTLSNLVVLRECRTALECINAPSCAYTCSVCIDAIFFVLSISTSAHAHSPIRIVCIGKHTKAFQYGTTTNTKYVKYCSVLDVWWQPFVCLCCISVFCSQWNTHKKTIRSSSRAAKRKRKRRRQKEKKEKNP